jgi:ADP-ribosylation factor related protein 1
MLFAKPNIHVLIIGLDHAGKTTILEKIKEIYTNNKVIPPEKIPPTVGMNLAKITYNGSKVIFWDLGGQMKMRSMWEKYYEESNCVIFVIDAADVGRLDEAKFAYGIYLSIFLSITSNSFYLSILYLFTINNIFTNNIKYRCNL